MDWEIILPIGFILLGAAGIVCAGLSTWYYIRVEHRESTGVSAALILFLVQYVLAYGVAFSRWIRLEPLPTILMFSIGLQSHKSGSRIGLAGALTVSAYFCLLAHFLPHH